MCSLVLILGLSAVLLGVGAEPFNATTDPWFVNTCECGRKPANIHARSAQKHSHPWLVGILIYNQTKCTGSLINFRFVLTAGNCVYDMRHETPDIWVALGMHNTNQEGATIVNIGVVIMHPNYQKLDTHSVNDLALIRLEDPVTFSDKISPICLPFGNAVIPEGREATVAGWGLLSEERTPPGALQETQVRVIPEYECRKVKELSEDITEKVLCTGGANSDACEYDSGGSLVWESRKRFEQIGIVSWGIGCAKPGIPSVYVKVSEYLEWIKQVTHEVFYCKDPRYD